MLKDNKKNFYAKFILVKFSTYFRGLNIVTGEVLYEVKLLPFMRYRNILREKEQKRMTEEAEKNMKVTEAKGEKKDETEEKKMKKRRSNAS